MLAIKTSHKYAKHIAFYLYNMDSMYITLKKYKRKIKTRNEGKQSEEDEDKSKARKREDEIPSGRLFKSISSSAATLPSYVC
jgi:hypothetical protein